jgi:glutamate mutase epsilon subunit
MMSRTLLIGIAVVMGIAVTLSSPLIGVILAAGVWIYLVSFSFLVFIVGTIIHNVIYGLSEEEEAVFLLISIVASVVFVVVTAGGVVTFLKGRQETS